MEDFSTNLPTWAFNEGYRLEGIRGIYNDLELKKKGKFIKRFLWYEITNIFELEASIHELENKEIK